MLQQSVWKKRKNKYIFQKWKKKMSSEMGDMEM